MMRTRGGWSNSRPSHPQTTTRSWVAARPDGDAPPEWLRRSYTRTVPNDVRTVEKLRLSFEDVRQQWRELCDNYACSKAASSTSGPSGAAQSALQPGSRSAVDRLVSQLKAIKQELLVQLTQLSKAISATNAAFPTAPPSTTSASIMNTAWSANEAWLADLLHCTRNDIGVQTSNPTSQGTHTSRKEYLVAVWLARRVWVWSMCLACATMDFELLSGSVSISTQLFFGCPFATPGKTGKVSKRLRSIVLHSCYDQNGAITEQELHAAVSAACAADAADGAIPVSEGRCEIRAFFGFDTYGDQPEGSTQQSAKTRNSSCFGPQIVSKSNAADRSSTSPMRNTEVIHDVFWVHAIALCYSIVAQDDTNAARLLSIFEKARNLFLNASEDGTESALAQDASVTPNGAQNEEKKLQQTIAFVIPVAKLLLDEDYVALQLLLQREGYLKNWKPSQSESVAAALPGSVDHEGTFHSPFPIPFAATCPEVCLVLLLVRLLGEHVVRRRWTVQQIGQAFRPIEPIVREQSSRKEDNDGNLNRLVCALTTSSNSIEMLSSTVVKQIGAGNDNCSCWQTQKVAAVQLCHALQMASLRDIGGNWPLPGPLLYTAFGGS